MKKFLLIYFLLIVNLCTAQQLGITFDEKEFDFGTIDELAGSVSHRFMFTNSSNNPLIVTSVHTSCGCTSPAWSKEPVKAGAKGYIDVNFDPRGRIGAFTKSIIVTTSTQESITLYINGTVAERPAQVAAEYPYSLFDLRLKNTTVNFGNIPSTSTAEQTIEVFNPSKANLVLESGNNPSYITIEAKPKILKPGQKGTIKVKFNAQESRQWDYVLLPAELTVNTYPQKINIKAIITEVFTQKQKDNPPQLTLENGNTIDFGTIEKDGIALKKLKISNTGKSDLIIRTIRNNNNCLTFKYPQEPISPGKSAEIQVFYNAEGISNGGTKFFSIISNCPQKTTELIKTNAIISEN